MATAALADDNDRRWCRSWRVGPEMAPLVMSISPSPPDAYYQCFIEMYCINKFLYAPDGPDSRLFSTFISRIHRLGPFLVFQSFTCCILFVLLSHEVDITQMIISARETGNTADLTPSIRRKIFYFGDHQPHPNDNGGGGNILTKRKCDFI